MARWTIVLTLFLCVEAVAALRYKDAVSSIQLNEQMYRIWSVGNVLADSPSVRLYALLAAADLCHEKGFVSFSVIDDSYEQNLSIYAGISEAKPENLLVVYFYKKARKAPKTSYNCALLGKQLESYRESAY